jgi:hypothetical protein
MLALEYSPAYAASITPAKIVTCPGTTDEEVREMLAQGLNAALGAQSRLLRFDGAPDEVARAAFWNNGPEFHWFAGYDRKKLSSLQQVFVRIPDILSSDRLDIICTDKAGSGYAWALPGIWKIHLGVEWVTDTDREDRIQTFVHEAAHIAGRSVAKEKPWYGKTDAHTEAHKHRPARPRMAMRSADNIGFYATDLAENFLNYM